MINHYRPYNLYRLYNSDNVLLYVGVTMNLRERLSVHVRRAKWREEITSSSIEYFADLDEALIAEKKAIADENPLYNIKCNPRIKVPPDKKVGHWNFPHFARKITGPC